ncbi:C4-dicarboxylate ABC transporter substrate-binding protein [Brevibacterium sp.]|uniref:C4-dicarboxylate ABC transporter substrate-binding protein n=1 Tax=Brevibacterium sp. TaxID=1701 RepID=UPI0025BBBA8E|nr:C4-dicarboxylate ABC transporter substrate-binding protein [Brevibacterium sp.]
MTTVSRITSLSASAVSALLLSACAGSAGSGGGGGGEAGDGYEYGAEAAAVEAAIADLEPASVTYQIPATSLESPQAPMGVAYKEAVEEASGGKLTVELAFNQSIAPYAELHDALADGRVDMAFTLPTYEPDRFPAVNAVNDLLVGQAASPFEGDLLANLLAYDLAWQSPEVLSEYEELGLTPFTPVSATSAYYSVCTEPSTEDEDWSGLQVRVGSQPQNELVGELGASPVSIAGVEAYEALQRGTVDCTLAVLSDVSQGGFFEVAGNLGYPTTTQFPRVSGAILQGSGVQNLPLAYQQILFDASTAAFQGGMETSIGSQAIALEEASEKGVTVEPLADDLQDRIAEANEARMQEVADSGVLGDEVLTRVDETAEFWTGKLEELGYTDQGDFAEFHDWYDPETDFTPLADALMERTLREHRPS